MKQTFLTTLALIGIFLCGAIVGGVVAVRYTQTLVQRKATEQQMGAQPWGRLAKQLNFDDAQREALRALLRTFTQEQQATRKKMQGAAERLNQDFKKILNPEQLSDYEKILARSRDNERPGQRGFKEPRGKNGDAAAMPPPPAEPAM